MVLVLSSLLMVLMCVREASGIYCNNSNVINTGKLQFTERLGTTDYVNLGHYRDIRCCAEGYTKIDWYRCNKTSDTCDLFPWFPNCNNCYGPVENGQVFQIHSAMDDDNASYKCIAQNTSSGSSIQHTLHLNIFNCDNLGKGPIFTDKPHDKQVKLGSNVSLPCEGYFGCGDASDRDVSWTFIDKSGNETGVVDIDKQRYFVQSYETNDGIIGENLTIVSVQKSDLNIKFICLLATDMTGLAANKNTIIMLSEKVVKTFVEKVMIAVMSTLVSVLTVIVILAVAITYWKPQLTIWVKSRHGRLPQRGDKVYDVYIWYCMEDEYIVEDLLPKLKERSVKIVQRSDTPAGPELQFSGTKLDESAALIVIFSDHVDEIEVPVMSMFINSVGTDPARGWSRVTVVLYGNVKRNHCSLPNSKLLYVLKYPAQPTPAELAHHNPVMRTIVESRVKKEKEDFFCNLLQRLPHKRNKVEHGQCDEESLLGVITPPASPMYFIQEQPNDFVEINQNNMDQNEQTVLVHRSLEEDAGFCDQSFGRLQNPCELINFDLDVDMPRVEQYNQNTNPEMTQNNSLRSKELMIVQTKAVRGDSGICSFSPSEFSPQFSPQSTSSDTNNLVFVD